MIARASAPSFAQLFTPKLITVFREGYTLAYLRADALAGLTVAIVALPLSMAIAIASGVTPDRGLYTARSAARRVRSSCWWRQPWNCTASTA
jgi:SulP family sulfate permease